MEYTKGDLVLVMTSFNSKIRRKYAIVQSQYFNSIKVVMIETGKVRSYIKDGVTPVTAEQS
mgnify:CR=1 FL=1